MNGFAAPFQVSNQNVRGLLAAHTMRIPELQRPFAWGVSQAAELVKDLQKLLEAIDDGVPGAQHFFGSLVVISNASKPDDIIDGQQRMTTVSLLLGLLEQSLLAVCDRCTMLARLENEPAKAQVLKNLANAAQQQATSLHNLLWVPDGLEESGLLRETPRLTVSPEIRDVYLALIRGDTSQVSASPPRPVRNLRAVAEYLVRNLIRPNDFADKGPQEQFQHLLKVINSVGDGLVVVRLNTTSASAGYELFESLNARGISLNALDHLKVWMLALFAELGADDTTIAEAMRSMTSGELDHQIKFFEDFYVARTRDTTKFDGLNRPKELVEEARKKVFREAETGPDNQTVEKVKSEVNFMVRLTPIWFRLRKHDGSGLRRPPKFDSHPQKDWINNRLELLMGTLQHQAAYPFLMVAAEHFGDEGNKFADLVHDLERFFFRSRTICNVAERKIVDLYNRFLEHLELNKSLDLDWIRNQLQSAIDTEAPDGLFKEKLAEKLSYANPGARPKIRYFFEMIDNYSYANKPNKRAGALNLNEWWIEHIAPQNPMTPQTGISEVELHCLGNLCLLPPSVNSKLSNLDFAAKKAEAARLKSLPGAEKVVIGLTDSTEIFYDHQGTAWSTTDISNRLQYLQDFALAIFAIPVKK